jgi:hypothetical protein
MKTTLSTQNFILLFVLMLFQSLNTANSQLAYRDGKILHSPESALILPIRPTLCPGSDGVELIANVLDTDNSYVYLWTGPSNDGANTKTIVATKPGDYSVQVWTDNSELIAILGTTVNEDASLSIARPGEDRMVCFSGEIQISLDAEVSGSANWMWQGGDGVFVGGRQALTGTYIPTEEEIVQGFVELTLVPTVSKGCEIVAKPLLIEIKDFEASASVVIRHASHETASDASIEFSFIGGAAPFAYQWSHGATTPYVSGLKTGAYQVKITDANGCEAWSNVTITFNSELE